MQDEQNLLATGTESMLDGLRGTGLKISFFIVTTSSQFSLSAGYKPVSTYARTFCPNHDVSNCVSSQPSANAAALPYTDRQTWSEAKPLETTL